jgi:hypothetical protein
VATQSQTKRHIPHRATNKRKIEGRAVSWERGRKRKDARRKAQDQRARMNAADRAAGTPTPWQAAKAARHARRHPTEATR